ncbi:MAG TPA: ADOP family duplicated permease, partial [Terriglobales bacterium]|nr:ADOP family duplicated permease [Terriglobales bacterium]
MTWTELRLRLRRLLMRQRAERDLQDEVDFHLAMAARAGWRAEASFGGTDRILEECRDLRRFGWLEDGWSDLVLALRRLRHAPLFAFAAVATLGLAIGANSAVFSIVDAVVLRPLPVSNPQQLVSLGDPGFSSLNSGEDDHQVGAPTFHQYQLLRDNSPEFSGVAAQLAEPWELQVAWGRQTGAEQVSATMVSGNFFSLLGLAPARGRFFDPGPDTPAVAPDVVLSYACWQDRFAGADRAIGQQLSVRGQVFTIIGVAPKGFFGTKVGQDPALYFPLGWQQALIPGRDMLHDPPGPSRFEWLNVVARLRPGVTLAQARLASDLIFHRTVVEQAASAPARARASLLTQTLPVTRITTGLSDVRAGAQRPLLILLGLAGLILAIVVVNLGGMTAAQAAGRRQEMGMRMALGASRGRLLRQLLTESLLVAAAGGGLGWLLGGFGAAALLNLLGGQAPVVLTTDWRVWGFLVAVCAAAALGFGLWPALRLSRLRPGRPVRGARQRLGRVTVVAQIAVALVLVMSAALFTRSLQQLRQVDIGFNPQHLVTFRTNAVAAGAAPGQALEIYRRLTAALAQAPGVTVAAHSENGLFIGFDSGNAVAPEGYTGPPEGANWDQVTPGYFAALGVPILLGRGFSPADAARKPAPVVIDAEFARRFFAGRSPIGQHITIHESRSDEVTEVIGVAGTIRQQSLRAKRRPRFYFDADDSDTDLAYGVTFELRVGHQPSLGQVQAVVAGVEPRLQVRDFQTVEGAINRSIAPSLVLAGLSGFFAGLALLMAAVGLYAMLSYAISRRRAEIGVRMALGAAPGRVRALFLREAATMVA